MNENEDLLTNSQLREEKAIRFKNKLEDSLKTDKEIIEITLGLEFQKRTYRILKPNMQDIIDYINKLVGNSIVKPLTARTMANILIRFSDGINKTFREFTREDIEKFFQEHQNYSECYKSNFKRIIKPFFSWIYRMEKKEYPKVVKWIDCNNKEKKLPKILEMEDIEKMRDACDNPRDKCLISMDYESGARASELLDLKVSDIKFDEYGAVVMLKGKTGQRRVRLVSSVGDIKTWLNNYPKKIDENTPLFCTLRGDMSMVSSSLNFIIKKISKRAGIEKRVFPHLFRHTRATHLAKHLSDQQMKIVVLHHQF